MSIETVKMDISGMTCEHCAATIARVLDIGGIEQREVRFPEASAEVRFDADKISVEKISGLIGNTGQYRVTRVQPLRTGKKNHSAHLIIIGGGSAAFAAAIEARDQGAQVTMLNDGLPTGGTCVNVGCVPSKYLIRAAETLIQAQRNPFPGIRTSGKLRDFRLLMAQKNELIEDLRRKKYLDIAQGIDPFKLIQGHARLVSSTQVEVGGEIIEGDKILVATGARPRIPPIDGLRDVPYLTNEGIFALDELPESLIVLGGRYIALETAQLFARLGSRVTVLQRSGRILPDQPPELTDALTGYLKDEGIEIVTGNDLQRVYQQNDEVVVETSVAGEARTFRGVKLLVATGRLPNTDQMGLDSVGVALKPDGSIRVDDHLQTSVSGIYAAGDVLGEYQYVYTAAYEGKLAARNALTGAGGEKDYSVLPWVIFTDPQVAGVGLDERQAGARGIPAETATLSLDQVPRALTARDTRGLIQLVRNRETNQLIGARILAPGGSELLMEVSLAIRAGMTVQDLTDTFHPYLTLAEGIKLAAITFEKDVQQLSCCAA